MLTPKQNAIAALEMRVPEYIPTFELEFQLEEEFFGERFYDDSIAPETLAKLTPLEKEKAICKKAEYLCHVYSSMEWSIFPIIYLGDNGEHFSPETTLLIKHMKQIVGEKYALACHGDGTMALPDGNAMYDFAYALADDPDSVIARAKDASERTIRRNYEAKELGIDVIMMCADYCYNSGPFVSPAMFSELIFPFLADEIAHCRKAGLYAIKHTDGNIMPILDQLIASNPHAIHSLDPMAGVDIAEVKKLTAGKTAICGNVHCAALQTGSDQDVTDSALYAIKHGKPGGGYIYCTSNVPFKGMKKERYQMVLDIWKQHRTY